jgi:iron(III) transport system substrate-binding protein
VKRVAALLGALLLGCSPSEPPRAPVVVFAAVEDGERLAVTLEKFTNATDIPVDIRSGTAVEHVDAMIAKTGEPADVVIADDLVEMWRAADRGALRPIRSAALGSHHESLRDADLLWFVHEIRPIAVARRAYASPRMVSFEDLGSESFKDRLCLSSSSVVNNRVLLANLIERNGERWAERLVRRWIRNLAEPPFEDEASLRAAIQSGACDYGIVSNPHTVFGNWDKVPAPRAYAATAVGVGRHAVHTEAAQVLADWMLRNASVRIPSNEALPPASIAGWRDEEVRLLAERAGYR